MIDRLLIVPIGKEVSSKMYLREYVFLDIFSKKNVYISYESLVFKELIT